jgi:DNA-binding YbaB/EbfC family protein
MKPEELTPLLQRARELQTRLASVQNELAARRFEGSAGGGMVTAVVTGGLRVVEIRFEPSLLAGGDRDMVQDLTAAAVNAALATAQAGVQEELRRASAGFGLPNPFGTP